MRNMLTETRNKHFSERLYYADSLPSGVSACHNGNIAAAYIANRDTACTFSYSYDAQNRLLSSVRLTENGTSNSERFTYDEVGNISYLKRYNNHRKIDDLFYWYGNEGNRLLSVTDHGQDADGYNVIEYHNTETQADTTFLYDANGNLVSDLDRGISTVKYNILNLPDTIQFSNGCMIINLYDAAGRKYKSLSYTVPHTATSPQHEVTHLPYGIDTAWYCVKEYAGNIERIYTPIDTTICIHNSIGYYTDSTYYHYVKDHLGNVCAVVNSVADTAVQATLYYASGVPMSFSTGRDKQPYLYNGKEFVEAHGLNTYDYGFRGYYTTIGRFTTIDPLAEQTPWQSPYSYAGNHFVNAIDWMGLGGLTGYTSSYGWTSFNFTVSSWGGSGSLVDILNYIIVDEDGIVLEADLTSPDKGIYLVNRTLFEGYVNNVINGNHLLFAQTFGTQIGVHRDMPSGTVLRGMTLDQSWYNLSATLGIVNSFYIPFPDFTPEPVTGKIHSAKMPFDAYMDMLYDKQGRIQSMDYMQYYNYFERGMITNPVVQGVAVGGLGVVTIESSYMVYYNILKYKIMQFGTGFLEGYGKALIESGPFTPYLYESPEYIYGSEIGSQFYDFIHRFL